MNTKHWWSKDWQGCQLVNPLCPDDLCLLPQDHEGYHRLGTMAEPDEVSDIMFMAPPRKRRRSASELYQLGWKKARELWPEMYDDTAHE